MRSRASAREDLGHLEAELTAGLAEAAEREHVTLTLCLNDVDAALATGDPLDAAVSLTSVLAACFSLVVLEPESDATDEIAQVMSNLRRCAEQLASAATTSTSVTARRINEDVVDSMVAVEAYLSGGRGPAGASGHSWFESLLDGRQTGARPGSDLEHSVTRARAMLRCAALGKWSGVKELSDSTAVQDEASFSEEPANQVIATLSLTERFLAAGDRTAAFGAEVWFMVTSLSWLLSHVRLQYALEGFRFYSLWRACSCLPGIAGVLQLPLDPRVLIRILAERSELMAPMPCP